MSTARRMVRTTLDLCVEEHRKLKAIAALKGVSFRELVLDCVREKYEKVPNEETLEAFRQSEAVQRGSYSSSHARRQADYPS